jgi:TRAP-type C4-dicarboxylate transport system permease large subunit
LLPHVAGTMAVIGFFSVVLDTKLNETSAPLMMPMIMVMVLLFDKLMLAQGIGPLAPRLASTMRRERSFEGSVRVATTETAGHLGGYIFLIVMSQGLGGVIERSGLIRLAPEHFSGPVAAMGFLAVALVVLGMFMEPLGAIFLVSGSLAPLAADNGIDPIHFWIMVLVAFELGYLMPPIALNQLLARQVVGDAAVWQADAEVAHQSFYRRHERWILPCGVMTLALGVVAFVPLFIHGAPAWLAWVR